MIVSSLNLVITATLDCNFHCPWCKRWELNSRFGLKSEYMTVETGKQIIERYPKGKIVLTGGEPMLNTPLLKFMVNSGRNLKVSTNGSILWPDDLPFHSEMHFDISMNSTDFPPLYLDLLEKGFPSKGIRFFVYLDKNFDNVLKIIDTICQMPNNGYEVLPEMWTPEDPEYERFIKEVSPYLAEKWRQYKRDDGFRDYTHPTSVYRLKKRFDVHGNPVVSLWLQGCPKEDFEELSKIYIYNENNFMQEGAERYQQGIKAFGIPVEYYTAMMYEEMKKYLT